MSKRFKKIALALAIGLMLVPVFPVAADFLVCVENRPDRGCCDPPSTSDARTDSAPRLVDGADCRCCVKVQVVSNTTSATVQKFDADWSVESGGVGGHVAPLTRRMVSVGSEEPDNARLPSLRTVVLLI